MAKIIFVIPSISDSHFKNRITEFQKYGYEVEVFGFARVEQKRPDSLPYKYTIIGELCDKDYFKRTLLYLKAFKKLGNTFKSKSVLFYLTGLDIALFFHFANPSVKYIYEECDLAHTYRMMLKKPLEWVDKRIIKKSVLTVLTSGGFIEYHFAGKKPDNVVLVENKLNPSILNYPSKENRKLTLDSISLGFVGGPRFNSIYNFIDVFCRNYPNGTFHVYGGPVPPQFEQLRKYKNCVFHGFFNNPSDLPDIYQSIDLVVATYDTKYENVKYAEPNKIYESIYFETPIVVSKGTFLASKVEKLGIGYSVDAMNENEIVELVRSITSESIEKRILNAQRIDKRETLNINEHLFKIIDKIWKG